MFVARIAGHSMEPGAPDGSWAVFRMFPAGSAPSVVALDGRRVVVHLRDDEDRDTGGRYTLKRWRVAKRGPDGSATIIELRPDNPDYKVRKLSDGSGELRVVAELIDILA
jgi:hypothetical protein